MRYGLRRAGERTRRRQPQAFVDQVSQEFRALLPKLNISNDDFIRTTEERHIATCTELWRRIEAAGDIYLDHYEGWYAIRDEAFTRRYTHRAKKSQNARKSFRTSS